MYGDLIRIYPKSYSIYLRGTIGPSNRSSRTRGSAYSSQLSFSWALQPPWQEAGWGAAGVSGLGLGWARDCFGMQGLGCRFLRVKDSGSRVWGVGFRGFGRGVLKAMMSRTLCPSLVHWFTPADGEDVLL